MKFYIASTIISLAFLAACSKTPNVGTAPSSNLIHNHSGQSVIEQMRQFEDISQRTTKKIFTTLSTPGGVKSASLEGLPPQLVQQLSDIYNQTVAAHPELKGRPAWLADSAQVVQSTNLLGTESTMYGLYTVAVDLPSGMHTSWSNKILINLDTMTVADHEMNSLPKPTFIPVSNLSVLEGKPVSSYRVTLKSNSFAIKNLDTYNGIQISNDTTKVTWQDPIDAVYK